MLDLQDLATAEKAASWSGRAVYYTIMDGSAWIIEPDTGNIVKCAISHFKKYYMPYSVNMPPAIRAKLQDLPPFREWKRKFQCAGK